MCFQRIVASERNLEVENLQMTLAGICNAIAFVALVSAIKILSVTRYNLVSEPGSFRCYRGDDFR